jgi:GNAT superfamily N-acetyltransferase
MIVHLRPPFDHEWPICRMLLPDAAVGGPTHEFLLCVLDEAPRFIGAASFRQNSEAVTDLRMHVIPAFRRRGVGRQIVKHLARDGARSVSGSVALNRQQDGAAFCVALGFERIETLTTVETELADIREYLRTLCARRPPAIKIVPLSQVSAAEAAELHARYVARGTDANPWRALFTSSDDYAGSVAAIIDGALAGVLLGGLEGDIAVVRSRIAVPGAHRAWVNAVLMAEALDGAWSRGARRVRFTYDALNRDTQKLARRFHAKVTQVLALFTLSGKPRI